MLYTALRPETSATADPGVRTGEIAYSTVVYSALERSVAELSGYSL